MARERKPNESAIKNMIAFLVDLQAHSDFDYVLDRVSITFLATKHKVSQTAGSILKELGIIEVDEAKHSWQWKANNPERKMALIILDKLLQKRKPGTYTPLFPDMAKIVTLLEEISAKLNNVSPIEINSSQGFILSEEEKRFKLVVGIASNIYDYDNLGLIVHSNSHQPTNALILTVAEDLLKQYNQKFI